MKRTLLAFSCITALGASAHADPGGPGENPHARDLVTYISAPIFPKVLEMYPHEGANMPATLAERTALAQSVALTFEELAAVCLATDSGYDITPRPETADEIATNYNEIAKCAYEHFTAKPYWIPQLVDEVDLCGLQLGEEWHLLSEADVNGMRAEDFAFMQATLAGAGGEATNWGNFYFSLDAWVRMSDGTLARANLAPGVTGSRFSPLGPTPESPSWQMHLEGNLSLRCVRSEIVDDAISSQ